jgi:hypothetical protein
MGWKGSYSGIFCPGAQGYKPHLHFSAWIYQIQDKSHMLSMRNDRAWPGSQGGFVMTYFEEGGMDRAIWGSPSIIMLTASLFFLCLFYKEFLLVYINCTKVFHCAFTTCISCALIKFIPSILLFLNIALLLPFPFNFNSFGGFHYAIFIHIWWGVPRAIRSLPTTP